MPQHSPSTPAVEVDADPIYIRSLPDADRPDAREVWTSAGVTAGIDLALALVEDDHSTRIAQAVARRLVMFLRRPGGQTQFAAPMWIRQAPPGPIRRAQESDRATRAPITVSASSPGGWR